MAVFWLAGKILFLCSRCLCPIMWWWAMYLLLLLGVKASSQFIWPETEFHHLIQRDTEHQLVWGIFGRQSNCVSLCVGVTGTEGDVKGNDESGDAGFTTSFHQPLSAVKKLQSTTSHYLCHVYVVLSGLCVLIFNIYASQLAVNAVFNGV